MHDQIFIIDSCRSNIDSSVETDTLYQKPTMNVLILMTFFLSNAIAFNCSDCLSITKNK